MYELRRYKGIRPAHMGRRSGKKTYKKKTLQLCKGRHNSFGICGW